MTSTAVPPASGSGARSDIQALRAVAVASVVLFHLWPTRLPGGYVGVDVFFVISGFLITSHLLREVARTGNIRLAGFWARRAKRLLPAAFTVLILATIATVVLVPVSRWQQFLSEVIASALYVQNWLLAANSVDYLAADNPASPVQHFWTLSVEEQFYLVMPLLLVSCIAVASLARGNRRTWVGVTIATATVASFGYSVWLTATNPAVAYFSTFTRAWEFGAGALLAFAPRLPGVSLRRATSWLGIGLIVLTCLWFDTTTAFPGYAAALPVAGTALVILADDRGARASVSDLGAWSPVSFLGRVSYAIYLWHWPLIVLLPFATGHPLTTVDKLAVIATSLVLAYASTRWIEEPVRFSPRLLGGSRRPRVVAAWSVAGMIVVTSLAGAALVLNDRREAVLAQVAIEQVAADPSCLGAQAMDPALAPCVNDELDGILVPAPELAPKDDHNPAACWSALGDPTFRSCTVGPVTGYAKRLFAVGDSHNNMLLAAYRAVAAERNWRIDVAGHNGCYWTDAVQANPVKDQLEACEAWKDGVTGYLASQPAYDGILTTYGYGRSPVVPTSGSVEQTTVQGLSDAWKPQIARGTTIIAIRDIPRMRLDVVDCVVEHRLDSASACSTPRAEALRDFDGLSAAVKRTPGSVLIDLTDFYCDRATCLPVIGHVVAYRDRDHLTYTYAGTLGPYLGKAVAARLAW